MKKKNGPKLVFIIFLLFATIKKKETQMSSFITLFQHRCFSKETQEKRNSPSSTSLMFLLLTCKSDCSISTSATTITSINTSNMFSTLFLFSLRLLLDIIIVIMYEKLRKVFPPKSYIPKHVSYFVTWCTN